MTARLAKQATAMALVLAILLGVPGAPCQRALALNVAAKTGGAAVAPSAVRVVAPLPASLFNARPTAVAGAGLGFAQAPLGLSPAAAGGTSVAAPSGFSALAAPPSAAASAPSAWALPATAIPGVSAGRFGELSTPSSSRASEGPAASVWGALQRLGTSARRGLSGAPASAEMGADFNAAFDMSRGVASVDLAPAAVRPFSLRLGRPGALAAAGTALVAAVSPAVAASAASAAPAVTAAAAAPSQAGKVVAIGLAVVGLGLFLFNVAYAAWMRQGMRKIEAEHAAYNHALDVVQRHQERLKRETGAVVVSALQTAETSWELVLYHNDPATLAAQKPIADVERLPVRAELITPESVGRVLLSWRERAANAVPVARFAMSAVKKTMLSLAVVAGALALAAAASAAPLAAPAILAAASGSTAFQMGAFWLFFFVSYLLFDRSLTAALIIGWIAGMGHPLLAFLVGACIFGAQKSSSKRK